MVNKRGIILFLVFLIFIANNSYADNPCIREELGEYSVEEDCDWSQVTDPADLKAVPDDLIQDIPEADRARVIQSKYPNTNFEGDITGDVTLAGGTLTMGKK